MIENTQKIKKIIMKPTAITKCEIGQDWYQNCFEIVFIPNESYPDYMQVEAWIMQNIDGKELNIEDAVNNIYRYLYDVYSPKELHVIDKVVGNKVHFDVIVEK